MGEKQKKLLQDRIRRDKLMQQLNKEAGHKRQAGIFQEHSEELQARAGREKQMKLPSPKASAVGPCTYIIADPTSADASAPIGAATSWVLGLGIIVIAVLSLVLIGLIYLIWYCMCASSEPTVEGRRLIVIDCGGPEHELEGEELA